RQARPPRNRGWRARDGARLLHDAGAGQGVGTRGPDRGKEPGRSKTRGVRVVILGGTRFIGRAIVEELSATGHTVLVVHRGELGPGDMPFVAHLHCDRSELTARRADLAAFQPDAAIDCRALTRQDAQIALDALPDGVRLVVISSLDVYCTFGALNDDRETDPVPLDHASPSAPSAIHIAARCRAWMSTTSSTSRTYTCLGVARRFACRWSTGSTTTSAGRSTSFAVCERAGSGFLSVRGCGWRAASMSAIWLAAPDSRSRHHQPRE